MSTQKKMRWFEQQRMSWIEETLRIFGFINREHLMRKFDLSVPQASKDLNTFRRLYPEAMVYDLSQKRYLSTAYLASIK